MPTTQTKIIAARPARRSSKCPKPGRNHAATAASHAAGDAGTRPASGETGARVASDAAGASFGGAMSFKGASAQNRNDFLLDGTRDAGFAIVNIHIHLASHAEFRQINARLDGKARVR